MKRSWQEWRKYIHFNKTLGYKKVYDRSNTGKQLSGGYKYLGFGFWHVQSLKSMRNKKIYNVKETHRSLWFSQTTYDVILRIDCYVWCNYKCIACRAKTNTSVASDQPLAGSYCSEGYVKVEVLPVQQTCVIGACGTNRREALRLFLIRLVAVVSMCSALSWFPVLLTFATRRKRNRVECDNASNEDGRHIVNNNSV